jgi:hypothetical protein
LKKTTGKFQLHRETLHRLVPADLRLLIGGEPAHGPAPTYVMSGCIKTGCPTGCPTCA